MVVGASEPSSARLVRTPDESCGCRTVRSRRVRRPRVIGTPFAAPGQVRALCLAIVVVIAAVADVDETEHPVVEEVRAVHADDQVAAGLEEAVCDQGAI
jgi:hypothetical protein